MDCGKSVNFTHYDHLVGVSNRRSHPALVPEPHAGLVFRRRGDRASDTVDLNLLEKKLRRSKREVGGREGTGGAVTGEGAGGAVTAQKLHFLLSIHHETGWS